MASVGRLRLPRSSIFRLIIVPLVAVMVALAASVTWLSCESGREAVDRLVRARMNDASPRAEAFVESLVEARAGTGIDETHHAAVDQLSSCQAT